jgi:hypothetical protein
MINHKNRVQTRNKTKASKAVGTPVNAEDAARILNILGGPDGPVDVRGNVYGHLLNISVQVGPHDVLAADFMVRFMTEECAVSLCNIEFSFGRPDGGTLNHMSVEKKPSGQRRVNIQPSSGPKSE